jgi:tetratricopeptide (TPR) repeat protein
MAKASFPDASIFSSVAFKFAILISVNAVGLDGSHAQPRYHCPSGQIYRVSKKLCVAKETAFASSTSSQKSEELSVAAAAPNRVDGPVGADPAARIASLNELFASIEKPKIEPVETPHISRPEPVTPSKESGVDIHNDGILQARVARQRETSELEQSVALYHEALKQETAERTPLERAAIENNLANALATLGERERLNGKLEEAVTLYREALEQHPRERGPLEWATIQNNLGLTLTLLGERESGIAKQTEAIAVKREVRDWAMRTGNQGVTLMQLAEQLGDPNMARTALGQIDIAFNAIRDGDQGPIFAAYYEEQLPRARALVERLSQD